MSSASSSLLKQTISYSEPDKPNMSTNDHNYLYAKKLTILMNHTKKFAMPAELRNTYKPLIDQFGTNADLMKALTKTLVRDGAVLSGKNAHIRYYGEMGSGNLYHHIEENDYDTQARLLESRRYSVDFACRKTLESRDVFNYKTNTALQISTWKDGNSDMRVHFKNFDPEDQQSDTGEYLYRAEDLYHKFINKNCDAISFEIKNEVPKAIDFYTSCYSKFSPKELDWLNKQLSAKDKPQEKNLIALHSCFAEVKKTIDLAKTIQLPSDDPFFDVAWYGPRPVTRLGF